MMKRFLVAGLLMATSVVVQAHQSKAAITTVLFNDRTQNIEVMHRFYLHDAEHAVAKLFDKNADLISDVKTQQTFADYVEKHFKMQSYQQKPLKLASVGHQLDGQFFWVYQEVSIPEQITGLRMSHGALHELWPAQINMVNVEGKGKVKTLTFSEHDDWLATKFQTK